jgi:uncharacterized protein
VERRDFGTIKLDASPCAKMEPADFGWVRWTRGFWPDRFATARDVTLPWLLELASHSTVNRHVLDNFRMAASDIPRGPRALCDWNDEWAYKWLEAASAVYGVTQDADLDRTMDGIIDLVARAQEPDGYIATQIQLSGRPRYADPHHHELYVMGHLVTAACIHHRATGKSSLLDVARKAADHVWSMYEGGSPRLAHFPFNPSIIMGAVELYRTTGARRYLDLANAVIDMRGRYPRGLVQEGGPVHPGIGDQNQDRVPLREETEVVGHNVLYTYLYGGAADAYMETGDESLLRALERLYDDFVNTRMYITGGTCALHRGMSWRKGRPADDVHEAVGEPFELPNAFAYNETCGQVGAFLWAWRMLHATGNARYADLMEREMYNGWLPGIDVEGRRFFYTNPLRWHGAEHRVHGNDSHGRHLPGKEEGSTGGHRICCPTNVLRAICQMHGYLYSRGRDELWIHHYGGSTYDDGTVRLVQETRYPWDGEILVKVEKAPSAELELRLRIPAWCERASMEVNGRSEPSVGGSYAVVRRRWNAGDVVRLELAIEPRLIEADPRLEQAAGQAAVMRGPLVYCLESPDQPAGVDVFDIELPPDIALEPVHMGGLLGGITVLRGRAVAVTRAATGLYRPLADRSARPVDVALIPYYAWANRGVSRMTVWMPLASGAGSKRGTR